MSAQTLEVVAGPTAAVGRELRRPVDAGHVGVEHLGRPANQRRRDVGTAAHEEGEGRRMAPPQVLVDHAVQERAWRPW